MARLVFAAVFASSAFGKLTARQAARDAVAAFGIAQRWVNTVAWALPIAEGAVALGLLTASTAAPAAAAGLVLLAVFTALIAVQVTRGRHPVCACFGAASVSPVGGATLVRNGVLIALGVAALASAVHYPDLPAGLSADRAIGLAIGVALATVQVWQGLALRHTRRNPATTKQETTLPAQLPVGTVAPEFDLAGAPGTASTLGGLLASGRPQVLVFLHTTCRPCKELAGELPVWSRQLDGLLDITVIGTGSLDDNQLWSTDYGITRYLVQHTNEVAARYAVRGTPIAVHINADGRIAAPQALGAAAIRKLLAEHHTSDIATHSSDA